jgi:hypothetical protein
VPPAALPALAVALLPFGYAIGALRTILLLLLGVMYVLIVQGILMALVRHCSRVHSLLSAANQIDAQYPIAPLHRFISWVFTATLARLALLILGLWWIPVTYVTRKRGYDFMVLA